METEVNHKKPDDEPVKLRNDPSLLIESLREKILQKVEEINSSAESEINKISEDLRLELENFRKTQNEKYNIKIEYEESRIQNLTSIEMKKLKLEIMESFIKNIMAKAASSIRNDDRYRGFLNDCISGGLREVKGGSATVLVSPDDMNLSGELMAEMARAGYNLNIRIISDIRAGIGGALVIDDETEVIYNNSVERIIYRKNSDIRREILRCLNEYNAGAESR